MAQKLQARYCACGCGGLCKGQWLPGHDQRLRAAIEHEVGGLVELRRIIEERLHRSIDLGQEAESKPYRHNYATPVHRAEPESNTNRRHS
ncbi:MAG: hypothetical protein HKO86_07190 [Gammaproteobacteria bacterium]|nr:hypothetical protein [Gammaproteobacteria bacterium]